MPEFYEKIHGWTDFTAYYEEVVREAHPGRVHTFVEIGVWQGRSLVYMAELIKELNKPIELFAVDNWTGGPEVVDCMKGLPKSYLEIFKDNLDAAGVANIVTVIQSDSAEAALRFENNSVDFAFIDASHSYEAVKADVAAWWPKIIPGGTLAGHDYNVHSWPGVVKAVNEFAEANGLKVKVRCGATWTIKKAQA